MEAAQTGLRAPIVASRQIDIYRPLALPGGERAWLLARSRVEQTYEAPGHRTPVLRVLSLEGHAIDPSDFADRRAAAHAGASVMLRDAGDGLVYLRRAPEGARPAEPSAGPAKERVPAAPRTRVRTLALGVLSDPNIERPLPFAGVGYADLDFMGTRSQVSAFLAGPFLQASWSLPALRGGRTQLQASMFVSLVRYHDRVFTDGRERYEENLRQRPATAAFGMMRPVGAATRLRGWYEVGWLSLSRTDSTAPAFVVPPSALTHGLRLGVERDARGWTLAAWSRAAVRDRWGAWGVGGAATPEPVQRGHLSMGVRVTRPLVIHASLTARVDAAALAGRGLDRFSRFTFDGLDDRLHGLPSAALRFDRGGVVRTAWTWAASPAVRLAGYADAALVRDPGYGRGARAYSGLGASADVPLPWHGHATLDWGYSPQAPAREGGRGAHVLRLTAYTLF